MFEEIDDVVHRINHIANILRVSLHPISLRNVNCCLSDVKGQVSISGYELEALNPFLFLGCGSRLYFISSDLRIAP
jgi:hypothetical protein